jgi:deoxycytidine triphosphate deaminase
MGLHMALVAGNALDPKKFFKSGAPTIQGSSFDLTIGYIFNHEGKKVDGPFTIKPGHMVQVVSSEVFCLSEQVTGHVTYKTTLTKKGVWALTVGIVDPGWDGPVATTLLNFSRVDHSIAEGDAFLRVSFFEHDPVPEDRVRKAPQLETYLKDIQKTAASSFPVTFLDSDKIAEDAGSNVLARVRNQALVWVASIAVIFTVAQLVVNSISYRTYSVSAEVSKRDFEEVRARMEAMQVRLLKFEQANPPGPAPAQPIAPASPPPVSPAPPRNP